jgi:DNA-binding MarR family transcriptional regulator
MAESEIALLVDRFMRRIHAGVHPRAQKFDTDRVGPGGGMILLTLADIEPAPIHKLVRELARDKSQMTRAIQGLERKGLVERQPCCEDARVCLLNLTRRGVEVVKGFQEIMATSVNEVLASCTPAERETLKRILTKAMLGPDN